MQVKTPLFRILRLCAPRINEAMQDFAGRLKDSPDGKITTDDLQQLGIDVAFRLGSVIATEVGRANEDIIAVEIIDTD